MFRDVLFKAYKAITEKNFCNFTGLNRNKLMISLSATKVYFRNIYLKIYSTNFILKQMKI